ncbi:MAG: MFS transporter [Formosimonas sp.]
MPNSTLFSRSFIALLVYRLSVIMCYQITAVVVGWQIYELTRDKLALGLIGLAEVVPYFACALFAGYAVDHFNRRRLGLLATVLLLIMTLVLTLLSIQGNTNPLPIYLAIALSGVARSLLSPVYHALMAEVLPRENYARAAGIGTTVFQAAQILGPALGGLLLALASPTIAYACAIGCALAAWLALLQIPLSRSTARLNPHDLTGVLTRIRQGMRFVWGHQVLFSALLLDMLAVLFGGAMAMLPAFVSDVLQQGPQALGLLRAAPALGAVLMGIYLSRRSIDRHAGRILLGVVAAFGLCMIGFALSTPLWLSFAFLALSGLFDSVSVVLRSTIMQLCTPDDMRGRVSSISGIFIGSSNELGAFESGLAANWLGLVPSVVAGGVVTLLVVLATARLAPQLRRVHISDLW